MESGSRTGKELSQCWGRMRKEVEQSYGFLREEEIPGVLSAEAAAVGQGSNSTGLRRQIMREIYDLRFRVLMTAVEVHPRQDDRGISSWKECDKLTSAFLLSMRGPASGRNSVVFTEACATFLCLPSRVCADRVGEKVGKSRVDAHR